MKISITKIILISFSLAFSVAEAKTPPKAATKKTAAKATAQTPGFKAVCKSMTPAAWKTNYDGCMTAFADGIQKKLITAEKSTSICNCVANGLVKESTCQDIDRFQRDKAFEQQMTGKLAKKCIPKDEGRTPAKANSTPAKKKKK